MEKKMYILSRLKVTCGKRPVNIPEKISPGFSEMIFFEKGVNIFYNLTNVYFLYTSKNDIHLFYFIDCLFIYTPFIFS